MDLVNYLSSYYKKNNISFHMPGHKGSGIFKMYGYGNIIENLSDIDITEIIGADNLHKPEGIIRDLEYRYAKLYGAKKTFLLINGSTAGILSAIMATVPEGKKILVARNCHKSVYSGTVLSKSKPVYVMPREEKEFGIIGEIKADDIEKILIEDTEDQIKAIIIPSPNYYGICSDIKEISKVAHKYGKILIVDQAHGAHLKFFEERITDNRVCGNIGTENESSEIKWCHCKKNEKKAVLGQIKSAESSGADIVINSTHKTLASFTQSGILNVMTDRVDIDTVFEKLQLVQSTSPSYILMASLGINCEILEKHREELFENWEKNILYFLQEGEKIPELNILKSPNLDWTKINMSLEQIKITGEEFEELLFKKGINMELATGNILMAMTGIGNTKEDYKNLVRAIKEVVDDKKRESKRQKWSYDDTNEEEVFTKGKTAVKLRGRDQEIAVKNNLSDDLLENSKYSFKIPYPGEYAGIKGKTGEVKLENAAGCISKDIIAPYPPGIPFVCPGERITEESVGELLKIRGENRTIIGVSGKGTIRILTEDDN